MYDGVKYNKSYTHVPFPLKWKKHASIWSFIFKHNLLKFKFSFLFCI